MPDITPIATLRKLAEEALNGPHPIVSEMLLHAACTPTTIRALCEVVEAADATLHWHDVHEKNNPNHVCGFAAEYSGSVLRAALAKLPEATDAD